MIWQPRWVCLVFCLGVYLSATPAHAVLLLYEPFNYAESNFLSATAIGAPNTTTSPIGNLAPNYNNWYGTGIDTGGYQTANDAQVVNADLTVPGLGKPTAGTNALALGGTGYTFRVSTNSSTAAQPNKIGTNLTDAPDPQAGTDATLQATDTGGTGYYSVALRVVNIATLNTSGGVLLGFNNVIGAQTLNPTTTGAGLTIRPKSGSTTQFELGIVKQGSTNFASATWSPTAFDLNTTIFVVGKYQTVGALQAVPPFTTDDVASLWINPAPSTFGGFDPAGALTNTFGDDITTNSLTNNHSLQSFILRQTGISANNQVPVAVIYDELRVGTNWADVTPGSSADYNHNGIVDAADYILWRKGGPLKNEVDAPGVVNAADYAAWRARFASGQPANGAGFAATVPEPAALAMLCVSGLFSLATRKRK